jgi:hypothetical protein
MFQVVAAEVVAARRALSEMDRGVGRYRKGSRKSRLLFLALPTLGLTSEIRDFETHSIVVFPDELRGMRMTQFMMRP